MAAKRDEVHRMAKAILADKADPVAPPERARPVLLNMADVTRRDIDWLWHPWLPVGEMCLLDGDPGVAKSTLTVDWVARLSRGWDMPPAKDRRVVRKAARVVILSAEDDPETVIRPRLDAAGADCDKVRFFPRVQTGEKTFRLPTLPEDLELLTEHLAGDDRPRLVVVDPLMAFIGGHYDAHKDSDIRHCLHRGIEAVRTLGACLLMVRHLNKMNLSPALYRGGGSIGIIGAARVGMVVGRDPNDRDRRVIAQSKNNLAVPPLALAYGLETDPDHGCGRIAWDGETDLSPDEILSHAAARPAGRPDDRLQAAVAFLRESLADGNVRTSDLEKAADSAGVRSRTLKLARKELGVEAFRIGSEWYCRLPDDEIPE